MKPSLPMADEPANDPFPVPRKRRSLTQTGFPPIINRNLPDPFILSGPDGGYYLYATGRADDGRFLPIWHSLDLHSWQFVCGAVEAGSSGAWNRRNFWAPEVLFRKGRYWLFYTAMPDDTPGNTGNRVGVAVAHSPAGPFKDRGVVIPHASLDGSPFVDANNTLWLYHTGEFGNPAGLAPGRIYVDRLIAPDRPAGSPRELIGFHPWQEGPCARLHGNRYFLFYSTGSWGDATYGVRWAVGDSPEGPFEEGPGKILQSSPSVPGPGHHNFFSGPDGGDWIVFHAWDRAHRARYPRLGRLQWAADGPSHVSPVIRKPGRVPNPRATSGW